MQSDDPIRELESAMNDSLRALPCAETVEIEDGIVVFRDADGAPIAYMHPDAYAALLRRPT